MSGNRIVTFRTRSHSHIDRYDETTDLMTAIGRAWAGGCLIEYSCRDRAETVWVLPALTGGPVEYVTVACHEHRDEMHRRAATE